MVDGRLVNLPFDVGDLVSFESIQLHRFIARPSEGDYAIGEKINALNPFVHRSLQELFDNIRTGMKSLGLEEIKEILRVEVKKTILHAHHVHLGTNEFNPLEVEKSLDSVSPREQKFKEDITQDLNGKFK